MEILTNNNTISQYKIACYPTLGIIPISVSIQTHSLFYKRYWYNYSSKHCCFLFISFFIIVNSYLAQGTWTKKTDFGGGKRCEGYAFSIGNKGYLLGGLIHYNSYSNDLWEWDESNDTWTQKQDFPDQARVFGVAFSIGTKGYFGTGVNLTGSFGDFWEWDQSTNVWTKKADFAGGKISTAVAFSIGTKGYIGTGYSLASGSYTKDFWEWDQATNAWTKKIDFGGIERSLAVAFSIGTKGYIGTGYSPTGHLMDFWEWDQATNIWSKKADFGGGNRTEASSFSIGNYGYIGIGTSSTGSGSMSDFWKYDPSIDSWIKVSDFGGAVREMAQSFSIGCHGYIANGFINDDYANSLHNDLWDYYDSSNTTCKCNIVALASPSATICSGQTLMLTSSGGDNYLWKPTIGLSCITCANTFASPTLSSTYTVTISTDLCPPSIKNINIIVKPVPTILTSNNVTINEGTSVQILGSGKGNPLWIPTSGLSCNTCWNPIANPLNNTTYYLTVTDSNGCKASDSIIVTLENIFCETVFIPDAFSPNGDNSNEIFYARIDPSCVKSFSLSVFNRWGQKIFESSDPSQGWNGKLSPFGEEANTGTYFYTLQIVFSNNADPIDKKGSVSLVR